MAGDARLRAIGLIDTEPSTGLSWKFKLFLASRRMVLEAARDVRLRNGQARGSGVV